MGCLNHAIANPVSGGQFPNQWRMALEGTAELMRDWSQRPLVSRSARGLTDRGVADSRSSPSWTAESAFACGGSRMARCYRRSSARKTSSRIERRWSTTGGEHLRYRVTCDALTSSDASEPDGPLACLSRAPHDVSTTSPRDNARRQRPTTPTDCLCSHRRGTRILSTRCARAG